MRSTPASSPRTPSRWLVLGLPILLLAASLAARLAFSVAVGPASEGAAVKAQPGVEPALWLPTLLLGARSADLPTPIARASASPTAAAPVISSTPDASPASSPTPSPTPSAMASPGPAACGALPSFETGLAPTRELHVASDGDDGGGDGSPERPFASLGRAAREARPGTAIRLHPGRYAGGSYLEDLRGEPGAPIWLGGLPGAARPLIEGGGTGLHLVRPNWLVLHDLELAGASANGVNADDGGAVADPEAARYLIFRDLDVHDIGGGGNQDCLKLSGTRAVLVADSTFARCGGGGSGIDMVGVHQALVARNRFEAMGANAIQVKGGSRDVEIRWNRMRAGGERVVNLGGSTGFDFFRPPLDPAAENAEARDVRLLANRIEGGDTPWAFVGCVDCLVAQNTVIEPGVWLMRILQETSSGGGYRFAPARDGRVVNNLFVFRRGQLRSDVNVGGGTAPETFGFEHNLWYALDEPGRSAPSLPAAERGGLAGRHPLLRADGSIPAESPAAGAGLAGAWSPSDLSGACWADPPAIGAYEAP